MVFGSRWIVPDGTRSNPGVKGRSFDRSSIFFGRSGRGVCLAMVIVAALIASCERTHRVEESSGTRPAARDGEWIERTPVSSSALRSVGYYEDSQTLEIEFTNRAVYRYYDVPPDVYRELMAAESHGRYFHQHVRDKSYRYQKMN